MSEFSIPGGNRVVEEMVDESARVLGTSFKDRQAGFAKGESKMVDGKKVDRRD